MAATVVPVVVDVASVKAEEPVQAQLVEDDIMAVGGIFVKQKVELLEVVTGYETKNKYKVFAFDDGAKGRQMFKAKEESECCERQCCGSSRGFTMNITSEQSGAQYLTFKRPFAWECFCACRSLCDVLDAAGAKIAEVFHPFKCCEEILEIRSPSGELWYRITPGCYCSQMGMVCSCPCSKACMEVKFDIFDGTTGDVVGQLMRHHPGCGKATFTDADNFSLTFPEKSNFAQRASLFAAIFVYDFLMFEESSENNSGGH